jgi:hypothetical protein
VQGREGLLGAGEGGPLPDAGAVPAVDDPGGPDVAGLGDALLDPVEEVDLQGVTLRRR